MDKNFGFSFCALNSEKLKKYLKTSLSGFQVVNLWLHPYLLIYLCLQTISAFHALKNAMRLAASPSFVKMKNESVKLGCIKEFSINLCKTRVESGEDQRGRQAPARTCASLNEPGWRQREIKMHWAPNTCPKHCNMSLFTLCCSFLGISLKC